MNCFDTISAIATPPGEGAIAIVRLSGKECLNIMERIYSGPIRKYASHTVHLGKILDREKGIIDSVLVVVMKAPRSYSGEDMVEIHCHGGHLIAKKILKRLLECGSKAAAPGEFTLRAFLNKKMDLTQAEAVQNLISAKSEEALKAAAMQLEGKLSSHIQNLQKELVDLASSLEALIDFPEDGIEIRDSLCLSLEKSISKMERLLETFAKSGPLFDGISVCITGPVNAGKSTLMNLLAEKEKSIVTSLPGTTRDCIEETISLGGLHLKLIDTAGIRQSEEEIEKEGIKRALKALKEADLAILVLDASRPLNGDDLEILSIAPKEKSVLVWNKIDIKEPQEKVDFPHTASISAKENIGLDDLKLVLERLLEKNSISKEETLITSLRHKESLEKALLHLKRVKRDTPFEIAMEDIKAALLDLSSIIGFNVSEEILSSIFSKFCIGK